MICFPAVMGQRPPVVEKSALQHDQMMARFFFFGYFLNIKRLLIYFVTFTKTRERPRNGLQQDSSMSDHQVMTDY